MALCNPIVNKPKPKVEPPKDDQPAAADSTDGANEATPTKEEEGMEQQPPEATPTKKEEGMEQQPSDATPTETETTPTKSVDDMDVD